MSQSRIAIFPGSFDPLTNGHVDLIRRAARLFDRVVVAILVNPDKEALFTADERMAFIREACAGVAPAGHIEVDLFQGLLVEYAARLGAGAVVRGLRNTGDLEYERAMASMNARLAPSIDTVCLLAADEYAYVSSRLIKEVVSLGGTVTGLVPPCVEAQLIARLRKG